MAMCPRKGWVHCNDLLELLYCLVAPAGNTETNTFVKIGAVRGRVEIDSSLNVCQGLIVLADHHQTSTIPRVRLRIFWIDIYRPPEFLFRLRPIVVEHVLITHRGVGLC